MIMRKYPVFLETRHDRVPFLFMLFRGLLLLYYVFNQGLDCFFGYELYGQFHTLLHLFQEVIFMGI